MTDKTLDISKSLSVDGMRTAFRWLDANLPLFSTQAKCIIWTGCRPSETLTLRKKGKWLRMLVAKKRGKKIYRRFLDPFPDSPIVPQAHPYSLRQLRRLFKDVFGFTARSYRKMYAEHAFKVTGSVGTVSDLLYHSNTDITRSHYLNRLRDPDLVSSFWAKTKKTQ